MKFKSIIEEVPVDEMGVVEIDCYKLQARGFIYYSPVVIFTDLREAMLWCKETARSKIGNEDISEIDMVQYEKGYWEATAFEFCMYNKGKFSEHFIWEAV